tara:strand:+ start:4540 stop:5418 length:879 start_codon:yes stop_codon:yes gene_type:complete
MNEIKTYSPEYTNGEFQLGFAGGKQTPENPLQATGEARAVAEVQAQYVIAKRFPRNQHEAYMQILESCKRPYLAEQAMYAYPRGGQLVEGASIRLAESMAQSWGNLDCGVREVSQANGVSIAEAYAIDLQTNTRVTKVFHVPHTRDTKKGKQKLTDARDIYELVANQGARRLRACILAIIPGDVVEAAVAQCRKTMETSEIPISEQIKRLVVAFDEIGVKVEHLESRLGHNLDATVPQEIVTLRGIFKSIKDGMSKREDFFDAFKKSEKASNEQAKEDLEKLLGTNVEKTKL